MRTSLQDTKIAGKCSMCQSPSLQQVLVIKGEMATFRLCFSCLEEIRIDAEELKIYRKARKW